MLRCSIFARTPDFATQITCAKYAGRSNDRHIMIAGYQAEGTIGRALVKGARHIRLYVETIRVKAHVHTIGGLSAHADQGGLMQWYLHCRQRPPLVLVRGEPDAMTTLQDVLRLELQAPVHMARRGEILNLAGLTRFPLNTLRRVALARNGRRIAVASKSARAMFPGELNECMPPLHNAASCDGC